MQQYRHLLDKEIATLTVYGCSAENWKKVMVVEEFSPQFVSNVHFSGDIQLGKFEDIFETEGGLAKHSGIYNCTLHNCSIGNNAYINRINNHIANYEIGEKVFIENVNLIAVDGESTFGNGLKVPVMIESGGREVLVFDKLSAPLAYMLALYRYQPELIQQLEKAIEVYVSNQRSAKAYIGKNTRIVNCNSILNVRIGEHATITGTSSLENGTIVSNASSPVTIGHDVQCKNFIVNSDSSITEASLVSNCYVGQGCIIGKHFSAMDSLLFANFQGLHGEATAIFAGPFTATHHKSSMLLAGMFSFMNAGSGTNQSNHMYKLGPVHQGVTERGVKTSSDSYIMWPARIGAFTVVLGRHKGNPDLSDLPFSYLMESDGESHLLPAINLHSAGTIRDVQKWPQRDIRNDSMKTDPICFEFLSPYTILKVINGQKLLNKLLLEMDEKAVFVWYQNCKIKRSAIRKGIELYQMAINQFIANQLSAKTSEDNLSSTIKDIATNGSNQPGTGQWVDMAGLIVPKSEVDKLTKRIISGDFTLVGLQQEFQLLHDNYSRFSWNFTCSVIEQELNKKLDEISATDVQELIEKGQKAINYFNDMILRDARKEYNSASKTSFGIDGDEQDKNKDFEEVRGSFETHPFILERLK